MNNPLKRRDFMTLFGTAALAWPFAASAQQAERVRRVGMMMNFPASGPEAPIRVAAFLQRLQELGWTDRHNVRMDYRLADNTNRGGVGGTCPGRRGGQWHLGAQSGPTDHQDHSHRVRERHRPGGSTAQHISLPLRP